MRPMSLSDSYKYAVMAGLVPAIHALTLDREDVDARDKPGHDEVSRCSL